MDNRQGFLTSLFVHVLLVTLVAGLRSGEEAPVETPRPHVQTSRVFLPPPAVLQQMAPAPPPRARPVPARPVPAPAPTPAEGKDRISVGAPSQLRQEGPLILRRDDDLTKTARGTPEGAPTPEGTPTPAPQVAEQRSRPAGSDEQQGRSGLRLPPLRGPLPPGQDGSRARPGDEGPSIASSLRNFERQLENKGPLGSLTGVGRDMGPLHFDPQGADFTLWINHFKDEVYRNWLVPQSVVLGLGGEVQFRFTVQRDGSMTDLTMLDSSGAVALDRAARGALLGSLFQALPADYAPPTVTMTVTFYYGAPTRGS